MRILPGGEQVSRSDAIGGGNEGDLRFEIVDCRFGIGDLKKGKGHRAEGKLRIEDFGLGI